MSNENQARKKEQKKTADLKRQRKKEQEQGKLKGKDNIDEQKDGEQTEGKMNSRLTCIASVKEEKINKRSNRENETKDNRSKGPSQTGKMKSEDTTHEDNSQIETEQIGNKRIADEDENKEMGKAKQARIEQNDGSIEQD
eukprot:3581715-Heterocapsa_arctica.AAC.1